MEKEFWWKGGADQDEQDEQNEQNEQDDDDGDGGGGGGGGGSAISHLKYNMNFVNEYFMFNDIRKRDVKKFDASNSTVASLSFSSPGLPDVDQVALMTDLIENMDKMIAEKKKTNKDADVEIDVKAKALYKDVRDNHLPKSKRSAPFMNIHDQNFGICEIRFRIATICAAAFQLEQFMDTGKVIDFYSDYSPADASKKINQETDLIKNFKYAFVVDYNDQQKKSSVDLGKVHKFPNLRYILAILADYYRLSQCMATDSTLFCMPERRCILMVNREEYYDSVNGIFKYDIAIDWRNYLQARKLCETNPEGTIEHDKIDDPFLSEQAHSFSQPLTKEQREVFHTKFKNEFNTLLYANFTAAQITTFLANAPDYIKDLAKEIPASYTSQSAKNTLLMDINQQNKTGMCQNPNINVIDYRHLCATSIRPNDVNLTALYDRCWERLYCRIFRIDAISETQTYPESMQFNGQYMKLPPTAEKSAAIALLPALKTAWRNYHDRTLHPDQIALENSYMDARAALISNPTLITAHNTAKDQRYAPLRPLILAIKAARDAVIAALTTTSTPPIKHHMFKLIGVDAVDPKTPEKATDPPAGFFLFQNDRTVNEKDMEVQLLLKICTDKMTPKTALKMLAEFERAWSSVRNICNKPTVLDKVRKNEDWTDISNLPFIRVVPDVLLPLMYKVFTYLDAKQRKTTPELRSVRKTLRGLKKKFKVDMKRYSKSTVKGILDPSDAGASGVVYTDIDIERIFKGQVSLVNFRTIRVDEAVKKSVSSMVSYFSSGSSKRFMEAYRVEMMSYMQRIVNDVQKNYLGLILVSLEEAKKDATTLMKDYTLKFNTYLALKQSYRYSMSLENYKRQFLDYKSMKTIYAYFHQKDSDTSQQLKTSTFTVLDMMDTTTEITQHLKDAEKFKRDANDYYGQLKSINEMIQMKVKRIMSVAYERIKRMEEIVSAAAKISLNKHELEPFLMITFILKILYFFNEDFGVLKDAMGSMNRNIMGGKFGASIKFNVSKLDQEKYDKKYETKVLENAEYKNTGRAFS
jgi:hypothetical protein